MPVFVRFGILPSENTLALDTSCIGNKGSGPDVAAGVTMETRIM